MLDIRRYCVSVGLVMVALLAASCSLGTSDPKPSPEPLYITATPGATFTPTLTLTPVPPTSTEVATSTPIQPDETETPTVVFAPTDPQGTLRDSSIGTFMRYTPGTLGEITRVLRGSQAFLLTGRTDNNRWLEVKLADDFTGWIATDDVATSVDLAALPITGTAREDTDFIVLVKLDAQDLNLREIPYEFGRVIMQLDALTPLQIKGRLVDNSWYQVATEQGINGWVSSTFIDVPFDIALVGIVDTPSAVVANAPTSVVQPGITGVPLLPTATFVPEGYVSPTPSLIEPTQPPNVPSSGVPSGPPQDGRQAQVATASGGLRLRQMPNTESFSILNLRALTPLKLNGRLGDNSWVLVELQEGYSGWVAASYLDYFVDLNAIAVVSNPQPVEIPDIQPPADAPSVVRGVTGGARNIFVRGQQLGNNSNVFTVIGDSISATPYFLREFQYNYNLQDYGYLLPVLQHFTTKSFDNTPISSYPGWMSWTPLSPDMAPGDCGGASPMVCDFQRLKPSVALIMLGTNDARSFIAPAEYQANMTRIVETSIEMGVIPVLSTIPPRAEFNDYVLQYNDVVRNLAAAYDIPLWDFYQIVVTLENRGLGEDGVHLSIPPNAPFGTVDFTADNLRYGTTMRNLTALQLLDSLWRNVMY